MTPLTEASCERPVRVAVGRSAVSSAREVVYVLRTLLTAAGFPWVIEWADESSGPVDIGYGEEAWHGATIRIPRVPWEFSRAPEHEPVGLIEAQGIAFPRFAGEPIAPVSQDPQHLALPVDVLFACYWWLTGAREPTYPRDRWDNIDPSASALVREGLLRKPGVSLLAALLRARLEAAGRRSLLPAWSNAGAFCLTHDVDYPEIIRWLEVPRVLAARGIRGLGLARDVALGRSHFWTFREWVDFAATLGTRPTFYFMARRGSLLRYALGTPDDFYDIGSPRFTRLFDELRRADCEIGLHASFHAHTSVAMLERERRRVEETAGVSGIGNRHHYWHLDPRNPNETLRRHEAAGLLYDSSLAFEFYPGFRRGICHPFRPFHPGERRTLDIVQLPPAWMDDHFDRRLARNGIADPTAVARELLAVVRATGGIAVVDYHSRGMNAEFYPRYGPWLTAFVAEHLDRSVHCATARELVEGFLDVERNLVARSAERLAS